VFFGIITNSRSAHGAAEPPTGADEFGERSW
jgi:hypothetical protein